MKGDILPDDADVTRLCTHQQLDANGWPKATAFLPRPTGAFVSVNWLEALRLSSRSVEVTEILRVLRSKRSVGQLAKLALLHVGRCRAMVTANTKPGLTIQYRHEPETQPDDPSHSGIDNIPHDDNTAAELLALSVEALYPSR
ncbi:hypothetical protein GTP44_00415 [Duganella sp. FT50W]|uniref:Uncharacterized protein n=1 Tax=Duganella lactea TaxID=2692173 RepID=A0A6L8MF68_9BURK|nr:hypothetical protein [Duganella lactea]MYM33094.1 hypothetical protein [Duganella lactea]MYM80422.1 hypothetical protein [Duganella lactea]